MDSIVMKFGGTSIEDSAGIERVVNIIKAHERKNPILVFSAMGKTTRNLLRCGRLSEAGNLKDAVEQMERIRDYHLGIADGLIGDTKDVKQKIESFFLEVGDHLDRIAASGTLNEKLLDSLLSFGELIATVLMERVTRERGLNTVWMDSRELIKTNSLFTRAVPDKELTYSNIRREVLPLIESNKLPLVQGFIGSTVDGETTTLGFEGSDFTATLIGSALDVSEIQIWKDVPGIMSADPVVVRNAFTIAHLSYEEASQLTISGAKVLHPRTIWPAAEKNIPIHIRSSKDPVAGGTIITSQTDRTSGIVKSIGSKNRILCLRLCCKDRDKLNENKIKSVLSDLPIRIYEIFKKRDSISIVFEDSADRDRLIGLLGQFGDTVVLDKKAVVSLIGEGISKKKGFEKIVSESLDGLFAEIIESRTSPIRCTLIVDEENLEKIVERLHRAFFGR